MTRASTVPTISTDMANVSLVVPSIHPLLMIPTNGAVNHQPEFTAACITASADRAVIDGAIALAAHRASRVAKDEKLRARSDGPRMMLEHALLRVTPGREEEFEASIADGAADPRFGAGLLRRRGSPSGRGRLGLPVAHPLGVDRGAHGLSRVPRLFERWRELTHPFYIERPTVTHFHEPMSR